MTPYREKVNKAARAMWFGGVRQWPTADYPQELTQYSRAVLDEAWAQIQASRRTTEQLRTNFSKFNLGVALMDANVTRPELAARLGVRRNVVTQWCKRGVPPARYMDVAQALKGRNVIA